MFGAFRFYLAILVVARHLIHVPNVGEYAVSGFFVLSGYLMTFIMHESYGYSSNGLRRFWSNRALRLYPVYMAILAISVFIILVVGTETAAAYHSSLVLPTNFSEAFFNATMIYPQFFPSEYPVRLSPTTWALTVELTFYLLISLGISRNRKITIAWLIAGIAYTAYFAFIADSDFFDRDNLYYSIIAGSLPFSIGSALYYVPSRKLLQLSDNAAILLVVGMVGAIALNAIGSAFAISVGMPQFVQTISFILNIVFSALCVYVLAGVAPSERIRSWDKWLGDLSYPIYLLHIQMGLLVASITMVVPSSGRTTSAFLAFVLATVLSIGLSLVLVRLIDGRVDKVRSKIRSRSIAELSN